MVALYLLLLDELLLLLLLLLPGGVGGCVWFNCVLPLVEGLRGELAMIEGCFDV